MSDSNSYYGQSGAMGNFTEEIHKARSLCPMNSTACDAAFRKALKFRQSECTTILARRALFTAEQIGYLLEHNYIEERQALELLRINEG